MSTTYRFEDHGYGSLCWTWQGALNADGYGKTGSNQLAHRISYEFHRGSIPVGHEIDHLCRNRACVNPDHLEAVRHRVNVWRGANTKLTYEIACQVRSDFDDWTGGKMAFCRAKALELGVCSQNVYKIVSNQSWVLADEMRVG